MTGCHADKLLVTENVKTYGGYWRKRRGDKGQRTEDRYLAVRSTSGLPPHPCTACGWARVREAAQSVCLQDGGRETSTWGSGSGIKDWDQSGVRTRKEGGLWRCPGRPRGYLGEGGPGLPGQVEGGGGQEGLGEN